MNEPIDARRSIRGRYWPKVSQSLGFRFLLSSIFLVKPMPCPYQVCSSFDEALTWVRDIAARRSLALPPVPNVWNV